MSAFTASAVAIGSLMIVTWLLSLALHDAGIVDIAWGLGFVLVAWVSATIADPTPRTWLLAALVTAWGLRLAAYLARRNLGKPEDYRYQALRRRFGAGFPLMSLVVVFGLQGVLMWIVSLPVQAGTGAGGSIGPLAWLGTSVWVVGVVFETVGDLQLARFKADPANRGAVLDTGLWRYTRHPNYFGDFAVWWGIYLIAADAGAWWTAVGPLVMSILLMRVSGVSLLEKTIGSRRAGYDAYVERTNAFFPGPPREKR